MFIRPTDSREAFTKLPFACYTARMKARESTCDKDKVNSRASSLPTPPGSAEKLSLARSSPSLSLPAQRAIGIIKDREHGRRLDGSWVKIRLEPGDFTRLKKRLEEEDLWAYVEDKIRFDYDPETHYLIFRMPSGTHEVFTKKVVREIEFQLRRISEDKSLPDIAAIAGSMECLESTDIIFELDPNGDHDYPKRSPDASFALKGAGYPCIVIETSFSQKKKDLPRLADDYIIGSRGNIKVVIGLDIEYRESKKATVSVWESEIGFEDDGTPYLQAKKTVDDDVFRNNDRSPISPSAALHLPFSTFSPSGAAPSPDAALSIPFTTLLSFLEGAERIQADVGPQRRGCVERLPPGTQLRKRQRTPEEQLLEADEAIFAAGEEKAESRAYLEDGAWGSDKRSRR